MKRIDLTKRLAQEEYILGGIKPSSKQYQKQFDLVKDLKVQLEFLDIEENSNPETNER